jgi:ABC-2 type transport system permease protein
MTTRIGSAIGAVLRVGFKESVAYRAELLVWILATTMPLVMLALFAAVARDAPVGGYGEREFVAYFLATFLVRQFTGSWAAWQMNMDVRDGTLAVKLLRPIHPLLVYALEGLAALPMRLLLSVPLAAAAMVWFVRDRLSHDPVVWLLWLVSLFGGWLITSFINFVLGCLAFFVDSATRAIDVYLAAYFVGSGYLFPVDLLPPSFRRVIDVLPFRYQIALPVELMIGRYDGRVASAAWPLAIQWAWVFAMLGLALFAWRRGIRRFSAFGG